MNNRITTTVFVILLLGAVGFASFQYGKQSAVAPQTVSVETPAPTPVPNPTTTPSPSTVMIEEDGVTWLPEPQKLPDLKLFTNLKEYYEAGLLNILYFKVGVDHGDDIILASVPPPEMGGDAHVLFLKKPDGAYAVLMKHSNTQYGPAFAANVSVNNEKHYRVLDYQEHLQVKGITLTGSDYPVLWSDFKTWELVQQTAYGLLVDTNGPYVDMKYEPDALWGMSAFILKLPDGEARYYSYNPAFLKDDRIPQITWNDGTINQDVFREDGTSSCGGGDYVAVLKNSDGLRPIGKTVTNETVYEFSDTNNPVFQEFYKRSYDMNPDTGTSDPNRFSADQYRKNHGVFVYKDPFGRAIIFSNTKYGGGAECGKPVIYLYPTKPTQVSVKVDAQIRISEPNYGNGWNVMAYPDGKLVTTNGTTYRSLYWEGTGKEYPIVREGFIVAKKDLPATLNEHLTKLGLSKEEKNDFLEFWLPKMPETPYIRLTWFGTRQMEALAPLTVTPKPDTVIRIFLDFEGLSKPISLPVQRLSAKPREGFTVIEWGGLLRTPIQP